MQPDIIHTVTNLLHQYGYGAVALLICLEDFGLPLPGETILVSAAVAAGAGHLNIWLVMLIAFGAAVLGDNIGYTIGRYGGRPLLLRYGRYVFLSPGRLQAAENWFSRHGAKVVTVARFVEGLRQANGLVAGIIRMPRQRFLMYNALGAALWVSFWSGLGYYSGHNADNLTQAFGSLTLLGSVGTIFSLGAWVAYRWRRHRRLSRLGQSPTPRN